MLSSRLKALRNQRNISQKKISEDTGISRSAYSNYESGIRNPSNDQLVILAKYFDVSTDFLLGMTDDPTPVRDVNADMISENVDEELKEILQKHPELRVAFMDFPSWSDADKQELLNFIKFKVSQMKDKNK